MTSWLACCARCRSAERKDPPGFKLRQLQAADRDIISLAWLKQCAAERRAVPLRPRHYIHLSAATREVC